MRLTHSKAIHEGFPPCPEAIEGNHLLAGRTVENRPMFITLCDTLYVMKSIRMHEKAGRLVRQDA
jgi:hypothetical protein